MKAYCTTCYLTPTIGLFYYKAKPYCKDCYMTLNLGLESAGKALNKKEPISIPNETEPIWSFVVKDMIDRDVMGREKHGTPLQINNGRDSLIDAYQEALDLVVYLRKEIEERKWRNNEDQLRQESNEFVERTKIATAGTTLTD